MPIITLCLLAIGVALVLCGVALISIPLTLILAGVASVTLALFIDDGKRG